MSRTLTLAGVRVAGYARSQRAAVPLLATLVVLLAAHAGGRASAPEAYGFSAVLLFGIVAWQAKLLLDTEPDDQRALARLGVGSTRAEIAAGLLAAVVSAVPTCLLGLIVPLATGAVEGGGAPFGGLLFGLWVHAICALAAIGVGSLASRAVVASPGWSALLLVAAATVVLSLGSREVPGLRWLAPQFRAAIEAGRTGDVSTGAVATLHAVAWAGCLLGAYAHLRRTRV